MALQCVIITLIMAVEFEEENVVFNQDNSLEAQYQAKMSQKATPAMQISMLAFGLVCICLAFYAPSYINPPKKENVIYIEDITEARMRLLPPDQLNSILSKLPSRAAMANK